MGSIDNHAMFSASVWLSVKVLSSVKPLNYTILPLYPYTPQASIIFTTVYTSQGIPFALREPQT